MLRRGKIKEEDMEKSQKIINLDNQIKGLEQTIKQAHGSIPKVYYGTRTHRQIKQIIKVISRPTSPYCTAAQL